MISHSVLIVFVTFISTCILISEANEELIFEGLNVTFFGEPVIKNGMQQKGWTKGTRIIPQSTPAANFLLEFPNYINDNSAVSFNVTSDLVDVVNPTLEGSAMDGVIFGFVDEIDEESPNASSFAKPVIPLSLIVRFNCKAPGLARIEVTISAPTEKVMKFAFMKKCKKFPFPGFDIFTGSDTIEWQEAVSNGEVVHKFLPKSRVPLVVSSEELVLRFSLGLRNDNHRSFLLKPIFSVDGVGIALKERPGKMKVTDSLEKIEIAVVGDGTNGALLSSNFTEINVIHDCLKTGEFDVAMKLRIVRTKQHKKKNSKPGQHHDRRVIMEEQELKLKDRRNGGGGFNGPRVEPVGHGKKGKEETMIIHWKKKCTLGIHPDLDITTANYIPYNKVFYPVMSGHLTNLFTYSQHAMVIRAEEAKTKFYVSVRRNALKILDPQLKIPMNKFILGPSTRINIHGVGDKSSYDSFGANVRPGSAQYPHEILPGMPFIFEVQYDCIKSGEEIVTISFNARSVFKVDEDYLSFSFTKVCHVPDYQGFNIGTDIDSIKKYLKLPFNNQNNIDDVNDFMLLPHADTVWEGHVRDEYHINYLSNIEFRDHKTFYLYMANNASLSIGHPSVISNNNRVHASLSGSVLVNRDKSFIGPIPTAIKVSFQCWNNDESVNIATSSIITITLPVYHGKKPLHQIQFSFIKSCAKNMYKDRAMFGFVFFIGAMSTVSCIGIYMIYRRYCCCGSTKGILSQRYRPVNNVVAN